MAAALAAAPAVATAQVPPLVLAGRVQKVHAADTTGIAGARVVLHRIGMREQGPVDSVAADAAGRFRFRLATPDTLSLYVVSVRHAGIGYFGEPVRGRVGATPAVTLTVYDTATTGAPLRTALRHLVVGPLDSAGVRRLLDIVQVMNPDAATRVAADSLEPLWWMLIPSGVRDPQVGEGEVSPDAARFAGDTVFVTAPFPPGSKQIVLSYQLPAGARRIALPVSSPTDDIEILVDDSTAVGGTGLQEEQALAIEGRNFRRFVARDVAAGTVVEVRLGGRSRLPVRTIAIVLAALGLAGGIVIALRPRPGAVQAGPGVLGAAVTTDDADALLGRLVALDEKYADRDATAPPEEWAAYQATRADLKARLARRVAPPSA